MWKTETTGRWVSVCAVILVGVLSPLSLRGQSDEEILRRMQLILMSDEMPVSGDFSQQESPDPTAPTSILRGIVAELGALGPGRRGRGSIPTPARPHVEDATVHFQEALDYFTGPVPDQNLGLTSISNGVVALGEAELPRGVPLQEKLTRLSTQAVNAARTFVLRIVDLAEAGGADRTAVAQTRAAISLGDLAVDNGNPAVAVVFFNLGFNFMADVISFHFDVFEQNIRDKLAGETIGYAYSIGLNGVLFQEDDDGEARTSADGGPLSQSPTKEMYIASMSKTISAVTLLQILHDQGISVEESISGYLPPDWVQGPNVGDITFRRLLTHRSGLNSANTNCCTTDGQSLASMQAFIAAGSSGASDAQPSTYRNVNYSLLRILIPQIFYGEATINDFASFLPLDVVYAGLYTSYVATNVLAPAGINKLTCASGESEMSRTLLYTLNDPMGMGLDPGDWSLACGATGWYLSANELASFLAFVRFTDDIIGPATRDLMDQLFLGWLDPDAFSGFVEGVYGVYRAHGGDYPGGSVAGMTGCMMNFHINVQASLVINSRGGNLPGHACTVLRDAFDEAWF